MSSMRDKIVMLILDSGEHIVGFLTGESDESFTIETPVSMMPDPQSNGQRMIFVPYLQFSKEETCDFSKRIVRHQLTPQDQLANGYYQQFGTGLELPDSGMKLVT